MVHIQSRIAPAIIIIAICGPLYSITGWINNPTPPGIVLNNDPRLAALCVVGCMGFYAGTKIIQAGYRTCATATTTFPEDNRSFTTRVGTFAWGGAKLVFIGPLIASTSIVLITGSKVGLQFFDANDHFLCHSLLTAIRNSWISSWIPCMSLGISSLKHTA